jgi:hypothetical protein
MVQFILSLEMIEVSKSNRRIIEAVKKIKVKDRLDLYTRVRPFGQLECDQIDGVPSCVGCVNCMISQSRMMEGDAAMRARFMPRSLRQEGRWLE